MDAVEEKLVRFVDSFVFNDIEAQALHAIKLVFEHLPAAVHHGSSDPVAREKMHNAGSIAGMAFAVAIDEGATIMLHQLYVRPDKQRAGTGELLLDEIEASFPEARRVVLEVEAANAKGVAFYRKHGFVEAGTSTRTGIPAAGAGTAHRLYEKLL